MPFFQITEPIVAGNYFFDMVEHYLNLLSDLRSEIDFNDSFACIRSILNKKSYDSTGFRHAKNLFFCALLCYYDKFGNTDERVIRKLFIWAFALRTDMDHLGYDSVNKYAIGENENNRYSNRIAMFSRIVHARLHTEIANIQVIVSTGVNAVERNEKLRSELAILNGTGEEYHG